MARLLALLIAAFPLAAGAGPYGPFAPDERYAVALDACTATLEVRRVNPPNGTADFSRAADEARLRIAMVGTGYYEAQAFRGGEPRGPAVQLRVPVSVPGDVGTEDAVCDDLNRDGVTDFVVSLWGHGNGLGSADYDRLVVLSSGDGYRFWVLPTMWPAAEDFVTFGAPAPRVLVTTAFVQKRDWGEESRSYFVYDLWAFHGGEVVSANSIDSRFPKWVRYTFKPQSLPAKSLSPEDKRVIRPAPRPPREALP